MKNFKIYLNRIGVINLCKLGLPFEPLIEGTTVLHSGVRSLNHKELHEFMEFNPGIKIENRTLVDSEGRIYGGIFVEETIEDNTGLESYETMRLNLPVYKIEE